MTLSSYPGVDHATVGGSPALPAPRPGPVPPAGAPPGPRPATVTAAFWVSVAQIVCWIVGVVPALAFMAIMAAGSSGWGAAVSITVVLGGGFLVALGAYATFAALTRSGNAVCRGVFLAISAFGLAVSALGSLAAWTTVLPVVSLALHVAAMVLLLLPASNAWFRR